MVKLPEAVYSLFLFNGETHTQRRQKDAFNARCDFSLKGEHFEQFGDAKRKRANKEKNDENGNDKKEKLPIIMHLTHPTAPSGWDDAGEKKIVKNIWHIYHLYMRYGEPRKTAWLSANTRTHAMHQDNKRRPNETKNSRNSMAEQTGDSSLEMYSTVNKVKILNFK